MYLYTPKPHRLTEGERRIANLIERGFSNAQIAAEKGNTESTVKVMLSRLYEKLELTSGKSNRFLLARAVREQRYE